MKMTSEWSGLATFGELDDKVIINDPVSAGAHNTGKTELVISASKVPVPVWMAWKSKEGANEAAFIYWMKNNGCADECFANKWADEIHFPSNVCLKSQINEENIAQVRVSNGYDGKMDSSFLDVVWNYLSQSCRHRGFGTKQLRLRINPGSYGFTRHTMELDGWTRLWYEYVPTRVAKSGKRAPLVVCMHGRGGTAESFISLSGMSRVAEERDFIVVFPEACVSQQKPGALRNLLLWEGSYKGEKIDDVKFILAIIEDVKLRCAIDESRIFACGQSSGGMMTSTLAQKAPDIFAAVAPWSALVSPDEDLCLPEKIEPAVPFFFLFGDVGGGVLRRLPLDDLMIIGIGHGGTVVGNGVDDSCENHVVRLVVGDVQHFANDVPRELPFQYRNTVFPRIVISVVFVPVPAALEPKCGDEARVTLFGKNGQTEFSVTGDNVVGIIVFVHRNGDNGIFAGHLETSVDDAAGGSSVVACPYDI